MQTHQQLWVTDSDWKMIRIDLSAEELDRINKPDIGIVGDAATILTAGQRSAETQRKGLWKDDWTTRAKAMEMLASLAPHGVYRRSPKCITGRPSSSTSYLVSYTSRPLCGFNPRVYRFRLPRHARLGVRDRSGAGRASKYTRPFDQAWRVHV